MWIYLTLLVSLLYVSSAAANGLAILRARQANSFGNWRAASFCATYNSNWTQNISTTSDSAEYVNTISFLVILSHTVHSLYVLQSFTDPSQTLLVISPFSLSLSLSQLSDMMMCQSLSLSLTNLLSQLPLSLSLPLSPVDLRVMVVHCQCFMTWWLGKHSLVHSSAKMSLWIEKCSFHDAKLDGLVMNVLTMNNHHPVQISGFTEERVRERLERERVRLVREREREREGRNYE